MNELLRVAQETARALHEVGAMDDSTMREIDALCNPPKRAFSAEDILRIRAKVNVSQSVFAAVLGIGTTTVQHWEQGLKKPGGPASRLLDIIGRKGLDGFC